MQGRLPLVALAALIVGLVLWALWPAGAPSPSRPPSSSPLASTERGGGEGRGALGGERHAATDSAAPPVMAHAWPGASSVEDPAAAGPSRVLAGWVVDSRGEPVTDALVTATAPDSRPLSVLSDEAGGFRFPAAPVGELRLAADGAELGATALMVAAGGEQTTLQLTLEASAWVVVIVDGSIPRAEDGTAIRVELHTDDAGMNTPFNAEAWSPSGDDPDLDEDGEDDAPPPSGERLPVATGAPGDRLRAVAGVNHSVLVRGVDPPLGFHQCGKVRAEAGAEVVVVCSLEMREAVLRGRLVASTGEAIAGLEVGFEPWSVASLMDLEGSWTRSVSGPDGRFELKIPVQSAEIGAFETTSTERWARLARRNVSVVAGAVTDLGEVTVMAVSEVPVGWMDTPFGGVGGLVMLSDRGISLLDVEPDCPLGAAGVEGGDVITHIEGLDAGTMHMSEALKRLRGDVGTRLAVTVRNPMGESWELELVRGVIRPGRENWPDLDPGAKREQVEIEFEPLEIGREPPPEGGAEGAD